MKWFSDVQDQAKSAIQDAPLPNFRHGLNVVLNPGIDFNAITNVPFTGDKITNCDRLLSGTSMPASDIFNDFAQLEETCTKIHCINTVYANDFTLLHIPKNVSIGSTIEIRYTITDQLISKLYILAETGSKARLVITKEGNATYNGDTVRVIAKENAEIDIVSINTVTAL
jgi:hypothetical protein